MGTLVPAVPQWLEDLIQKYAGPQQGNPEFEAIVAAGAKAESGWDPYRVQAGGGGRGLFQFDLGGMGAGVPLQQLFNPDYQASRIVPIYAQQYQRFKSIGQSGDFLAANVAGSSEKPYGYSAATGLLQVGTTAWNNYVAAWRQITSGAPIAASTQGQGQAQASPQAEPSTSPATGDGGGAAGGGGALDFGGSIYHVLVSGGLVLLAVVLVISGIWLLTSSKDLSPPANIQPQRAAPAAAAEAAA